MSAVTTEESRRLFEEWISAPPYEREITRYTGNEMRTAWPGQYEELVVQLAWEAWQEVTRRQQEVTP